MKLNIVPILAILYFLLAFIFMDAFGLVPVISLAIALGIFFTKISNGVKNLAFVIAAMSVSLPIFLIFLAYLPFAVFGLLLKDCGFLKSYVLGFTISFIPSMAVYLVSTYLSIPISPFIVPLLFYAAPIAVFALLRKKSSRSFEVSNRESIFILFVAFFTFLIAINIVDNDNLFIANSSRDFYRVENLVSGMQENGLVPVYDPNIASGEPTYLWVSPAFIVHFGLTKLMLNFIEPVLFYNAQSVFILLLANFALGILFFSIANRNGMLNLAAVISATLITGLNFYFLHLLESLKAFYAYPIAYLFLAIVVGNPTRFIEFLVLAFMAALLMTIHPAYGIGVMVLGFSIFIIRKGYYLKDRMEIKQFFSFAAANKKKMLLLVLVFILLPIFYVSASFIFGDFFIETGAQDFSVSKMAKGSFVFIKGFYFPEGNILSFSFPGYPDVNRIDDHKIGFFLTVFGIISLIILLILSRKEILMPYRSFALGYLLNVVILALVTDYLSLKVGGFYRTAHPYELILLGVSILGIAYIISNKYAKIAAIAIIAVAFLHSVPFAMQNISNIHAESFMSGKVYTGEIGLFSQLPKDGRVMDYGVFSNVIDYGIPYFTGMPFSRNERIELAINRTIFEKIHGQNSFGEPEQVLAKNGVELSNYLRMGGYKYVFVDLQHPIGNHAANQLYPDFAYGIYQNGPLLVLGINNTNYAEKVDLAANVGNDAYRQEDGYKFTAISGSYGFDTANMVFKDIPGEPEPLEFKRVSPTKVEITGNFEENDFVVFKEQYFPRWKAFMGGKEVPVYANNHDLLLIRANDGNKILLNYSVMGIERIFGLLSLIGYLMLAFFLLYFIIKLNNG